MAQTTERAFETYLQQMLESGGWEAGALGEWDVERALFPAQVFAFLQKTQPGLWGEMLALHGDLRDRLLIETLVKGLDLKGTLHIEPRFLCRDFFAFGKEISAGIWLRPEAALGKTNRLFPRLAS